MIFGVALASLGTLFEEISSAISKWELVRHRESLFTCAFLNLFFAGLAFAVIALVYPASFTFALASLPTFALRFVLEVFQVHTTIRALETGDRSTFSFLRVGTVPLLLLVDIIVGYAVGVRQMIGIAVIVIALLVVFFERGISRRGMRYMVLSTVNAVATISLYKYNIAHFNSVVGDQLVMHALLLAYAFLFAYFVAAENPLRLLRQKAFFAQSVLQGIGGVLESYALGLAPASIIIAAKRSSAVLWGMFSGNFYFKEKHLALKLGVFALLAGGIALLVA
ncbi:MAG: hypothetical protein Q7S84_00555 [bacterium]|nr:hypothetical protein [bacterium]